jgi:hypothetical protein
VPFRDEVSGLVLPDLIELAVADEVDEAVEAGQERGLAAADGHPLGGQGGPADLPAAVHLAEHHVVGYEDVVNEHGVEHGIAGQLAQRLHLDAVAVHIEQEVGDAIVLRSARIGPGEQHAPL